MVFLDSKVINMSTLWIPVLALPALFIVLPCIATGATFDLQGTNLVVTSDKLKVSFRGAEVVGILNQITGESYLGSPGPNSFFGLQSAVSPSPTLFSGNWALSGGGTAATFTASDATRIMSLTVSVDPRTQDVVLNADGKTNQAGVAALTWDANGFDMTAGKFILPAAGGISITAGTLAAQNRLSFGEEYTSSSQHWEAPLVVFQGTLGGTAIYSTDNQSLFKDLTIVANPQQTATAVFAAQAPAPWSKAAEAGPVEWRLAAYQGEWQAGARVYRDWHNATAPPATSPGTAWTSKIRTVVRLQFPPPYSAAQADALAKVLSPAQTLLYIVQWRSDGYDVNYPNYVADPSVKPLIDRAHQLGFHVMLHANMMGVSPASPDFTAIQQYQVRDPQYLQLQGWVGGNQASSFAYINPAAAAFRNLYVSRIANSLQTLLPDALHLDQSGFPWNDGNGPVGAMNYIQGSAQLHKDLAAAFPNLVFGGEGIYAGIAPFQSFVQMGHADSSPLFNPDIAPPVPITAYVLPNIHFYGGLGVPNPDEPDFQRHFQMFDGQSIQPDYFELLNNGIETPNYKLPDFARYMKMVSVIQQNDLVPDWDNFWNGAIVRYRGAGGAIATLTDSGTLVQFNLSSGTGTSSVYQRLHNSNQATSSAFVPGWPAWNGNRILGLDPAYQYWLDPITPNPNLAHITGLPAGVRLALGTGTLFTPDFAYFTLLPPASGGPSQDVADVTLSVPATVTASSIALQGGIVSIAGGSALIQGLPLNSTAVIFVTPPRAVTAGQSLVDLPPTASQTAAGHLAGTPDNPYCSACPPFTIGPQTSGGVNRARAIAGGPNPNTQSILSWAIQLPASAFSLSFGAGFPDSNSPVHAVLMTVRVNGTPLWQYNLAPQRGWQYGVVDLSPWQRKSALVELIADSLNANPIANIVWTDLTLGAAGGTCAASLNSSAPIATTPAGVTGTISVSSASGCNWSAASSAGWITVRPAVGVGNGAVNYVVGPNAGPARSSLITVAGHIVTVSQAAAPVPAIQAISDVWNYTTGIAPGAWVTITGTALASGSPQIWNLTGTQQLPTTLGGVTVTFNGAPAALLYVSPTQLNALVPASVVPGPVQIVVNGAAGSQFNVAAAATLPSVYAIPNTDGSAFFVTSALQGTGFLVGNGAVDPRVERAAVPGDILDLYAGGLGATADPSKFVTNQVFAGAYPLSAPVAVTVGGKTAQILFAGLTSPGLYLVRISIPPDLTAGPQPIKVSAGDAQTRASLTLMMGTRSANLVLNGSFESQFNGDWKFSNDGTTGAAATVQRTTATAVDGSYSVKISVSAAASHASANSPCLHCAVQFWHGGMSILQGGVYTLRFWAKTSGGRTMRVSFLKDGGDFHSYGLSTAVALGTDWQEYVLYFRATETAQDGRVNFYFGDQTGDSWLDATVLEGPTQ